MIKPIVICCIVLLMIILSNAEDNFCAADSFNSFNQCLNTSIHKLISKRLTDSLNNEIRHCFIDNQCPPPLEGNDIFGKFGNNPWFGNNTAEKVGECFYQTTDYAILAIDKCVQKNFTGFTSLRMKDFSGISYKDNFQVLYERTKQAVYNCPQGARIDELMFCVESVLISNDIDGKLQDFCNEVFGCRHNMPCDSAAIKQDVCSCAQTILDPISGNVNPYEDNFFTCLNQPKPSSRRRLRMRKIIQDMIDLICVATQGCDESWRQP